MKCGVLFRVFPLLVSIVLVLVFSSASGQPGINNLLPAKATSKSMSLIWTVPEADAHYTVRYSESPITPENFHQAKAVEIHSIGLAGTTETVTVRELRPGTLYYFAISQNNFPGYHASLSNVVEQATPLSAEVTVLPNSIEDSLQSAETSTHTLTISNSGDEILEIYFEYDYSGFVHPSTTSLSIAPDETVNMELVLDASGLRTGIYNDDFILHTNDPSSAEVHIPVTLHVQDNGFPVARNTGHSEVDFGDVYVGEWSTPTWTYIQNAGSEPLIISAVSVSNPDVYVEGPPDTLAGGEEYYLLFQYRPTAAGPAAGDISVETNDPVNPTLQISVTANAVESPVQFVIDKEFIMDTVYIGQSITQTLNLRNDGLEDLEFSINRTILPSYLSVTPVEGVLSLNETTDLEISFNATGLNAGTYYYEMAIENNDPRQHGAFILPISVVVKSVEVSNFSVVNYKTGSVLQTVSDRITLDAADPNLANYTIRANPSQNISGSIKFSMDGKQVNIDNAKPYYINNWILPELTKGDHTLAAQVYEQPNGNGGSGLGKSIVVTFTNSAAVTDFDVVNTNGDKLMDLEDGSIIDLSQIGTTRINIVSNTNINTVKSVKFNLNGTTARIDNVPPFAMKGTSSGDTYWEPRPGNYTLVAAPYMKLYGWGAEGVSKTIRFKVVAGSIQAIADRSDKQNGVNSVQEEQSVDLTLYPVPVDDQLNVRLNIPSSGEITLSIMDLQGRLVHTKAFSSTDNRYTVDTRDLGIHQGFYIVQIQQADGRRYSKKFLKN